MKNNIKIALTLVLLFLINTSYSQCFATLSAGYGHNSGKKTDGSFWVWGSGTLGQMGNGSDFDVYNPELIPSNANFQYITCGEFDIFGIKTNGTLWASGYNIYGQLGIGSTIGHISTFTQVGTATNWKQVAGGDYFTLALKTDNSLWGWGQNDGYQMGNNTCCANQLTPIQIGTATDWKTIGSSNARSGFAIKNNGTLWCWGTNIAYLLGDSSVTVRMVPTQHNPTADWDSMSVGNAHILALKTNATLWAWGDGGTGQTGQDPTTTFNYSLPFQIAGTWKAAACGENFSIGIKTDGTLWAWGRNDVGQLGDGGTSNRYIPVQLGTATNWDSVSCGYQHTIALRTDGSLWSWGTNDFGQLGNGGITAVATPTNVPIIGCTLGVDEFTAQNTIQINPNPVRSELTINYKGVETIDTIVLYDLTGKEVYNLEALGNNAFSSSFSISALQVGTYVVVLKNKGKSVVSGKIIKE